MNTSYMLRGSFGWSALLASAAIACSNGSLVGQTGSNAPAPVGTEMNAGSAEGEAPRVVDVGADPSLASALAPESAGPLVLRRLSPREYSNTLRDLLGDDTDPGAKLPDESNRQTGFTVYESASLPSVETFLRTAERLVAEKRVAVPECAAGTAEAACAAAFISDFGRRAFRRPVTNAESTNLLALFTTARGLGFEYADAVGQVVIAMLQSSGFLYLWEVGDADQTPQAGLIPLTQHQIASRLSYLFWGTLPDAELSAAADAGQLRSPEQIAAQASRLIRDERRLGATAADFHAQWLHIDNLDDLQKDTTLYPLFNDEVRLAFQAELGAFVSDVLLRGDGTVRSLLTASHSVYETPNLARIYGANPSGAVGGTLELNPAERSGIFTLAGVLASTGNTNGSNPPRRGKLLWNDLLCGNVPPPPANVPPVAPPTESSTTRERFESHTGNPCAGACHKLFDPLGFAFENYDGVGGYRTEENGFPVDSSGILTTPAGAVIEFEDAVELLGALSTSYEVDRCVADKWFLYLMGRKATDADRGSFEAAYRASGAGPTTDFSVRDFLAQLVSTTAFRMRSPSP